MYRYLKIFFLLFSFIPFSSIAQSKVNATVSNVDFAYDSKDVVITYDLKSVKPTDKFKVAVLIYKSPDTLLNAKSLTGEVGENIFPGIQKKIYWNTISDGLTLNCSIIVEVRATPVLLIPTSTHLIKSALFPGLGNYRLGNGSMYALYGVAAYGSVAASVWLNQKAVDSYSSYQNSYDIEESNTFFNNSVKQKNFSIACAGLAVAIWAVDIYSVAHKASKLKKQGDNVFNSKYYYNLSIAYASSRSNILKLDTRTPYDVAMDEGNAASLIFDYITALAKYKTALALIPSDDLAKKKVSSTEKTIANLKAREDRYTKNQKIADSLFTAKNFEKSIIFYDSLLASKPVQTYPVQKKKAANDSIAEIKIEKKYTELIVNGDNHYKNKSYDSAIVAYNSASKLRPSREYPISMIAKAKQLKIDDEYNGYITKADAYFSNKDYTNAKSYYEKSQKVKPSETYPQTKITAITNTLALLEKQADEKAYNGLIASANKYYNLGYYETAKSDFTAALTYKPSDTYATSMIAQCNAKIIAIAQAKTDKDYKDAISNGDAAYNNKEYDKAKTYYQAASTLKPSETYPKTKITEINTLLQTTTTDLPALFKKCSPAVFLIYTSDDKTISQGSGFFVTSTGVGVTNYHVYNGYDKVVIYTEDGTEYKIDKILAKSSDDDYDYIIFKVKNPPGVTFKYVSPATTSPEIGESVFAIGNPEGFTKTVSNGIVSGYRDDKNYIQTTAPITHGSSGGPLFNMKGEVIGITTMGKAEGNLNFAVNIKLLKLSNYK